MKILRLSAFLAAFLLMGSWYPNIAAHRALAGPLALPTVINLYEAYAFRNVAQEGDFMVIARFQLPIAQWDVAAGGPGNSAALTELYDGTTLLQRRVTPWHGDTLTPKVGDGLTGVYLSPAHGVTWNSASVEICITGDPTTFPTPLQACLIPIYQDAATLPAARLVVGNQLVAMIGALQANAAVAFNTYVVNGIITLDGTNFATDAISAITAIAPQVFSTGITDQGDDVYTAPEEGAFSSTTRTNARSSALYQNLQSFSAEYFSVDAPPLGIGLTLIFTLMVLAFSAFLLRAHPHAVPISAGLGCFTFFGISVGFGILGMGYMFMAFSIMILIGFFWIAKRLPG